MRDLSSQSGNMSRDEYQGATGFACVTMMPPIVILPKDGDAQIHQKCTFKKKLKKIEKSVGNTNKQMGL